ncbi:MULTISPECIES: endonuclease Q family protein [unclassified Pseudomonas]|uniref:endonuclease Q family protein n=1 Tax=unclassified Pseudomonas TaxID=196821 RepID=UPI001F581960|nr:MULTISPECIES: endonuclease Q family protein [unclassified Pseudomonas]
MIKTSKATVRPASPDTSTTSRPDVDTGTGRTGNPGHPGTFTADANPVADSTVAINSGGDIGAEPHVVVSYITDPLITEANARLAEISLPGLQTHLLQPHESVDGLYVTPQGQIYAQLEEGGYYRAELNSDSNYQIPWPAAPGVTPPVLRKIDGQSLWRLEAPWYVARSAAGSPAMPRVITEQSPTVFFVDPYLATLLPAAHESPDGIRKGPRGKIYVDFADGTIMVRRDENGQYRLASATTINVPEIIVEQIPGQFQWRRQLQTTAAQAHPQPGTSQSRQPPQEADPGPGKRARLPADSDPLGPVIAVSSAEEWKTWGNTLRPIAGDAIEMAGQHFSILDQPTHAADSLAFIKHPQFSATRFDAFENMLLTSPQLQPRGVVKLADTWTGRSADTWRIVDGLPFRKSLTQYVSDQFAYLSNHSANKIAREIFNRASHSEELSGSGINALFDTIKYWENRPTSISDTRTLRQDLGDPLMLLPPLPVDANGYVHMPLPSAEGLQRIDFNPHSLFETQFLTEGHSLRDLFKVVLRGNGYQVSHHFRNNARDALLVQRPGIDTVFILFTNRFRGDTLLAEDPTVWLKKKALVNKIEPHDKITLQDHLAADKIIYLAGTNDPHSRKGDNLVITRLR